MRGGNGENPQRDPMDLLRRNPPETDIGIIVGSRGVGNEGNTLATEHRVAGSRMTAILGCHARHNDGLNLFRAQDDIEIGSEEGAVAALFNDHLIAIRGNVRIDFDAHTFIHQADTIRMGW